jgi:predicted outer membrane protein
MMIRTLTLAALAAVLATSMAHAQATNPRATTAQPAATGSQMAPVDDALFAAAATIGNMAELTLSELGVQRATDPELKQFSQRMIDEHTRMGQEMMTLAAQQQLALPRTVDPRAQFCAQSLAGLSAGSSIAVMPRPSSSSTWIRLRCLRPRPSGARTAP